jgi:hypothetical protein
LEFNSLECPNYVSEGCGLQPCGLDSASLAHGPFSGIKLLSCNSSPYVFTIAWLTHFRFVLQCRLYNFVFYYENVNIVSDQSAHILLND